MPADPSNPLNSLLPFREIAEGAPDVRRVFTVRSDEVQSQQSGLRYTVDRLLAPDWVNVVCVTEDNTLVLVRQWRFGARAFTLELPAGLLEAGEDPVEGGLRELLEETGYAPVSRAEVQVIGSCSPNPAFMNNTCTTVFVPRGTRVATQTLDTMEEVEVLTASLPDVERMLDDGRLGTALGLVGVFFWKRWQEAQRSGR